MLRSLVKTGMAWLLRWGPYRGPRRADGLGRLPFVVGYHRVVEDFAASAKDSTPAMLVSRKMLARHLDWIGRRFRFISLDELGARLKNQEPFHEPVVAVTFDDGYRDVYDHAFPLLKQKGIPAAVFVVTGLMGTSTLQIHDMLYLLLARAFSLNGRRPPELEGLLRRLGALLPDIAAADGRLTDPIAVSSAALRTLPQSGIRQLIEALQAYINIEPTIRETHRQLTWEMISEMHRAGIVIGSHTVTHAALPNEESAKVREELAVSRRELETRLGATIRHVAYPDGRFNAATVRAAADSGYCFGYTTCQHHDPYHPLLTIPRQLLWENSCLDVMGRFSGSIMSCHVNRAFDFRSKCDQNHS